MAGKSLSTSTLSLRFMQNAHRAKQLKEVELERAEVKDDEKWEVSEDVQNSWGANKNTQSESTDVHEASYLPFLFSESDTVGDDANGNEAPIKKTMGRRVFNKKGEMVLSSSSNDVAPTITSSSSDLATSTRRKMHSRPVSISALGSSHLRGFEQSTKSKDGRNSKSARQSIFESSGVGTDLRSETRKNNPSSTTFLKPVGVDDPKDIKAEPTTAAIPQKPEGVIDGAQQKMKVKREREVTPSEPSEVKKKLKKLKNRD